MRLDLLFETQRLSWLDYAEAVIFCKNNGFPEKVNLHKMIEQMFCVLN